MINIITIVTLGLITILMLRGMKLMSKELQENTKQITKVKSSLSWSRRRELLTNKMLKKLLKKRK